MTKKIILFLNKGTIDKQVGVILEYPFEGIDYLLFILKIKK